MKFVYYCPATKSSHAPAIPEAEYEKELTQSIVLPRTQPTPNSIKYTMQVCRNCGCFYLHWEKVS